jgi:hypothetical protein
LSAAGGSLGAEFETIAAGEWQSAKQKTETDVARVVSHTKDRKVRVGLSYRKFGEQVSESHRAFPLFTGAGSSGQEFRVEKQKTHQPLGGGSGKKPNELRD